MDAEERSERTQLKFFGGFVGIGLAVFLYWYLSSLEAAGGSARVNVLIAALYNLGGKTLTCGLFGGLGVVLLLAGVRDLLFPAGNHTNPPRRY